MPELRTSIAPSALQAVLDSAPNAHLKGQAQFFTPIPFARDIAQHLPRYRPLILDLTCGNGQLLAGAANGSTRYLLGCDIDPCPLAKPRAAEHPNLSQSKITLDLTLL